MGGGVGRRVGGIIPARAGFTHYFWDELSILPDHPRSRGVYSSHSGLKGKAEGSSPLARGLLVTFGFEGQSGGIIPARAGFTGCCSPRRPHRLDHPRSRGVYLVLLMCVPLFLGSSPLARGLPARDGHRDLVAGIIPARAGFTGRRRRLDPGLWDHPRSRGVYFMHWSGRIYMCGSSPLARGLPDGAARVIYDRRIIPARAGFTRNRFPAQGAQRDHPRSRGVYAGSLLAGRTRGGSSPLARGLRWDFDDWIDGVGIIPARAGFTTSLADSTDWLVGSSPLARGLRGLRPRALDVHRIIPARAGFTAGPGLRGPARRDHPRSRGVY